MNQELPDVQTGFRKGRETKEQIANIRWIIVKARDIQEKKKSIYASLTTLMILTVWITTNWGKFLMRWKNQITLPAPWETCIQAKKQRLEQDMEQWTGSKLGKQCLRAAYCHPAYLIICRDIMRNTGLEEVQAGIKIARRNINNLRYADDTTLWQKVKN